MIPVALGLVGFIGYQTVRMGTDTQVARTPYAIDTSVAQAVVQNGVITVHAAHHAGRAPQLQRVAEAKPVAEPTDEPSAAPAASPSPSPTPEETASATASASPHPKPSPKAKTHARPVAKNARPNVRRNDDSDDRIAQTEVPHIQRAFPARTIATINVGREQPSVQNNAEATTPPITDAPVVRTAAVPEKPAQVAEAPREAEAPATVNAVDRIVEARMVYAAAPEYPEIARDQGVRGTSVVFVTVDPAGAILHVSVASSSGNSTLDRSALSAARSSRYVPPKVDGKPAIETYRVTYDFAP